MQYKLILSETFVANDKLYNSVEPFCIRQYLLILFLVLQNSFIFKINSYILQYFCREKSYVLLLVLIGILHILFRVYLHGGKRLRLTIPFPTSETIYKNPKHSWFCDVSKSSSENRSTSSCICSLKSDK